MTTKMLRDLLCSVVARDLYVPQPRKGLTKNRPHDRTRPHSPDCAIAWSEHANNDLLIYPGHC